MQRISVVTLNRTRPRNQIIYILDKSMIKIKYEFIVMSELNELLRKIFLSIIQELIINIYQYFQEKR